MSPSVSQVPSLRFQESFPSQHLPVQIKEYLHLPLVLLVQHRQLLRLETPQHHLRLHVRYNQTVYQTILIQKQIEVPIMVNKIELEIFEILVIYNNSLLVLGDLEDDVSVELDGDFALPLLEVLEGFLDFVDDECGEVEFDLLDVDLEFVVEGGVEDVSGEELFECFGVNAAGEGFDDLDDLAVFDKSGAQEFVQFVEVFEFEPVVEEADGAEVFELKVLEHHVVFLVVQLLFGVEFVRGDYLEIAQSDDPAIRGVIVDVDQRHNDPGGVDTGVDDVLLEP